MERVTFSLLFYIRRIKLNRHGEAPILMRITVNGVRADVSIKKTILPQLWDVDKGRAVDKKTWGEGIEPIPWCDQWEYSENSTWFGNCSLFDVFREHNDKCKKLVGISMATATAQRYETTLQHVQDFVWDTYRKSFFLSGMSQQFVKDYMFWLRNYILYCTNDCV